LPHNTKLTTDPEFPIKISKLRPGFAVLHAIRAATFRDPAGLKVHLIQCPPEMLKEGCVLGIFAVFLRVLRRFWGVFEVILGDFRGIFCIFGVF
jgi:hypothetical protein